MCVFVCAHACVFVFIKAVTKAGKLPLLAKTNDRSSFKCSHVLVV